ncbi:MAG: prephenate dehydratase [Burkholderiales bacterium]|jgi:chorismate mutase/prephenate dehydratase|nr:prephenate dehydratase [Burkholderiales bacterium]
MADEIAKRRTEIDALDAEIVARLARRAELAREIGKLKGDGPAYRPEREADVLRRVTGANPGPLPAESVGRIFTEIMSACRALEEPLAVAFLGPEGTFSEMAVRKQFGHAVRSAACGTIDEVFRQAETGAAHYAVVPVENSTEGAVGRTLDLMLSTPLRICAEVVLRVHQNAMRKGGSLAGVGRVYSHAQSLGQCQGWLARTLPGAARVPVASNAEAARLAASEADACAIGPALAAERYGLDILAANIEDEPNNLTRFLVLGRQDCAPTGADHTSLVMSAPNRPGAVHALLTPLAKHGVSMSRIESRPSRIGTWEYMFFVDLLGHQRDPAVAAALGELQGLAPFLKVLGSYPAAVQ